MSRTKEPLKSRHIKYLLYEDNDMHMQALQKIKEDNFAYIGIRHHILDFDGNEIIEDSGKPHFHIYQEYENPMFPSACAKRYGLLDDSGKPSVQFCRTVSGRFDNALVYLTHLNAPEKELYSESDLFGWSCLLRSYRTAALIFYDKHVDLRTALYAMLYWVQSDMRDKVIESADIIKWIIRTPYLRYRNERLFLEAVADHNKKIWAAIAREKLDGFSRSQIELNRAVGFDSSFCEMTDAEYQQLNLEGYK